MYCERVIQFTSEGFLPFFCICYYIKNGPVSRFLAWHRIISFNFLFYIKRMPNVIVRFNLCIDFMSPWLAGALVRIAIAVAEILTDRGKK